MFKIKAKSRYDVQVSEIYEVYGVVYEITRIGLFQGKLAAYGVTINGGSEETLFYIEDLQIKFTRKYIKKII